MLKSNVPGQYSDWVDEENDNSRGDEFEDVGQLGHNGSLESDEEEGGKETDLTMDLLQERRRLQEASIPEPLIRSILAKRELRHKTGPKGVLADYEEHKEIEKLLKEQDEKQRFFLLFSFFTSHLPILLN